MSNQYQSKVSQNIEKEKFFFDQLTLRQEYDVFYPEGYVTLMNHFEGAMNRPFRLSDRILDLGCGSGAFIHRFSSRSKAQCFGVDISWNALRWASKRDESVRYFLSDISNLCFKENSFAVVVFSGSLHHFRYLTPPLREAYRVLKKGGHLLSFDPNLNNPFMWLYRCEKSPFYSSFGRSENERFFSGQEVRVILEQEGFRDININALSGIPFKYVTSRIIRCLLPFYNFADALLGKVRWSKSFGAFLVVSAIK